MPDQKTISASPLATPVASRFERRSPRLRLGSLLLAATFTLGAFPTLAENHAPRSISVVGEAEQRVAPDMAMLSLEVVTEDVNAAVARREADATTAKALKLMEKLGIAKKDIDSTGLNVAPQYQWLKEQRKQELTGYRVTRTMEVRLLDLDRLGELITALSDAGVNRIQAPRLGLQNREAIYRQVLAAASANARERAAVIADTLDETLGPVLSVSVYETPVPKPMGMERMAMMTADEASMSPQAESYQSGYLSYRLQVSVSFFIGKGPV